MAQKKKDQAPKADHTPLADKADLSEQLTIDFSAEVESPKKPARKRTAAKKN